MTSLATDNDSLVSPGFVGQQLPSFETKGNQGWGELSPAFAFVKCDYGWIGATLDSLSLNPGKHILSNIEILCAGCFIVQPWLGFPMFWRQQHDPLHPSQWRLLWLWGEGPNISCHFHLILSIVNQSLQCSLDLCNGQDGSDEPGTSACPNGKFFCENAGHKALVIPSGRVSLLSNSSQCTAVDKLTYE